MLIRMAWRNLWRNRRRTIITLVSIAFGLFLSLTFTTMSDGGYGAMIDTAAKMGAAHSLIQPENYDVAPGMDLYLSDTNSLVEEALKQDSVVDAIPRIVAQAMAATANDSLGISVFAIDPEKEAKNESMKFLSMLEAGENLKDRTSRHAVIGTKMAEQLDVKIGSKIILTMTDKNGEVVSGLVRVKGIFKTGADQMDRHVMAVPIDWARGLVGYTENEATMIAVQLDSYRESNNIVKSLSPIAANQKAVVLPWNDSMPDVAATIAMDKSSNYFMQIIILILVAAGILNTVLMSVLERFREFGVMMAVGMTPLRLWLLVIFETFWMGIIGMILGIIASYPMYVYIRDVGIDFSSMMEGDMTVGTVLIDPVMRAAFYGDHVTIILVGVFTLIMLAGLYPATIASRTRPVDAIKTL